MAHAMRVNHLTFLPVASSKPVETKRSFDSLVNAGKAIEVTSLAGKFFPAGRVAIDRHVFEMHVAWPSEAMRKHLIYLDETSRLQDLLESAAASKRHESPAEFSVRGQCAADECASSRRHGLVLERFDDSVRTGWLIRQ